VGRVLSTCLAGVVVILLLIQQVVGGFSGAGADSTAATLPVPELLLVYFLGGTTAGIVIGILHRGRELNWWVFLAGLIVVVPVVSALKYVLREMTGSGLPMSIVERALLAGAMFGALWGWSVGSTPARDTRG
jgi:hypothetical protein